MLGETERREVEELVRRYIATHSRQFAELRASGVVDLSLLSRGALEHDNSSVRRSCLILLDHLGDERQVEIFAAALRTDPVPRNRRHALHALTCDKCKATAMCVDVSADIRAALADPNPKVRALAASVAG
jgi:HEAT repeat protein